MLKPLIIFFIVSSLNLNIASAFSQEYRWVDEKGVLHFSDNPPPEDLKSKPPLIENPESLVKEPEQKPAPEVKTKPKPKVNPPKKPTVKVVPLKSEEGKKLYDIRGKVAQIAGVDAIILTSGEKVKYIGVRDPSTFLSKNDLSHRMTEVLSFHEKLVKGKTVTVLLGKRKKDKKGNYLGHVFLGQQAFVNAELLRKGFAMTEEYPGDFEYQALFIRLQRDAQEKGLGIWKY
ncbi:MAG: thermonuclease family protein [Deltaproteobacteria bacterium]|nr:thermonuclease family protein [Deltaproteobacteria bacterium]